MTTTARSNKTTVSKDGRTATVSIPVTFLQRSGRKQILTPRGAAPWSPAARVDTALVKAVVRAHRWRQMLEGGQYASSAELAKAEKVNDSYLSRILRLTLIAPDIIEAILTGRQPSTLQLDDLLKPLPAAWALQHSALFSPHQRSASSELARQLSAQNQTFPQSRLLTPKPPRVLKRASRKH
jgi:hypothetical protein